MKINLPAFYTIKEIIKALEKTKPKLVVKPEGPEANYYHSASCPNCKKEFRTNILGYSYFHTLGETKHCPHCGQRLKWR